MTFLLSEDKALRELLQGMTVTDQKSDGDGVPRQVGVWFGQPDQEIRTQSYPYITIDMIDIVRETDREQRGLASPDYMPTPATIAGPNGTQIPFDPNKHSYVIPRPIPVSIDYQITTYARHPRHDRELMTQILFTKLPFRFGWLEILEKTNTVGDTTTNTSTLRRLDVINVSKRDVTEQAKRLFVNAISVRVSSEIAQETYSALYKVYSAVNVHGPNPQPGRSDNPDYMSFGSITITPPNNITHTNP
jgi:hypothetical protein